MTRFVLVLFIISSALALSCSGKELKDLIDNISQLQDRAKTVSTPAPELDNMNGEQFAAYLEKDVKPLAFKVDQIADFLLGRKENPNTPADEKECLNKYCEAGSQQTQEQPHFANGDYKIIIHALKTISDKANFCLDHCYDEKDGMVVYKGSNKPIEPQPTINPALKN